MTVIAPKRFERKSRLQALRLVWGQSVSSGTKDTEVFGVTWEITVVFSPNDDVSIIFLRQFSSGEASETAFEFLIK